MDPKSETICNVSTIDPSTRNIHCEVIFRFSQILLVVAINGGLGENCL